MLLNLVTPSDTLTLVAAQSTLTDSRAFKILSKLQIKRLVLEIDKMDIKIYQLVKKLPFKSKIIRTEFVNLEFTDGKEVTNYS